MPFSHPNIDRAIVLTQYDLRGFGDPLGFRHTRAMSPKCLNATLANLISISAGCGKKGEQRDETYHFPPGATLKELKVMCEKFAKSCDLTEREAIQLILREMMQQAAQMRAEIRTQKREKSVYVDPKRYWGRMLRAMRHAFEVGPDGTFSEKRYREHEAGREEVGATPLPRPKVAA